MTSNPSEIRAQIEQTRSSLSDNVDALAYQANPSHIAQRQVSKVKAAGGRFLDRLLGAAEDAKDAAVEGVENAVEGVQDAASGVADRASDLGDSVASVPRAARQQTQGNPLAAGVVAFGIGLLIAAAFPPSRKEKELAQAVKEQAQPLTDQLAAAGREVVQNLAEPAKEAVDSLKESATDAVQHVQEEGASAVADVKGVAGDAASDVAGTAKSAADEVKHEANSAVEENRL